MDQTAFARVKDAVLSVVTPRYRPVRRIIDGSVEWAPIVKVRLHTGSLRFVGIAAGAPVRVEATVRSRTSGTAERFSIRGSIEDGAAVIEFAGEFTENGRTCASVDALVFVPRDVTIEARNDLGPISIADVANTIDAFSALGNVDVMLGEDWNGRRVVARSALGNVTLRVPESVHLRVEDPSVADLHADLGKTKVIVE